MNLIFLFLNIIFFIMCLIFILLLKIKCLKSAKIGNDLTTFIAKSQELLLKYEKKQEVIQLRNSIKLYSLIRIILNIISPDYIIFFRYGINHYNNKELNFIFSVDNNGMVLQNNYLEKNSNLSNIINIKFEHNENQLNCLYSKYIKEMSKDFYDVLERREIKKVYFKNVYDYNNDPIGLILLSFKDENVILSECDKTDIVKIIDETKNFI